MSYKEFQTQISRINDILCTVNLLNWDARTVMPGGGVLVLRLGVVGAGLAQPGAAVYSGGVCTVVAAAELETHRQRLTLVLSGQMCGEGRDSLPREEKCLLQLNLRSPEQRKNIVVYLIAF